MGFALVPVDQARAGRRVFLYLRMSKDIQLRGEGVERQWEGAFEKACELDLDVVAVFIDNDQSALATRPEYNRMLAKIRAGEADAIVVWSQDRLLRQPKQLEELVEIAERGRPIKLLSTMDPEIDLTAASGIKLARDLVNAASYEGKRKGERQRARNRQRAKRGESPTSDLFGYEIKRTRDELGKVIHREILVKDDQADVVREVFKMYLSGIGARAIAADLNQRGWRNSAGTEWNQTSIRAMILNPRYTGERWLMTNIKTERGTRNYKPEYVGKGNWDAIVSKEIWQAAGRIMADPSRRFGPAATGLSRKWIGTGLYLCGVCNDGTCMFARHQSVVRMVNGREVKSNKMMYYCRTSTHCCRDLGDIDGFVAVAIGRYLSNTDNLRKVIAKIKGEHAQDSEMGQLESLRADAEAKFKRKRKDYTDDKLDIDDWNEIKPGLLADVTMYTEKINALVKSYGRYTLEILEGENPGERFQQLPMEIRSSVIRDLCEITVHRARRGRQRKGWRTLPGWRLSDNVTINWLTPDTGVDMTEVDALVAAERDATEAA
jgi:DNA invertase Pin-like site-specific DNA recombinase